MNALLQIVDAASTPLLALIVWMVFKIMTNDLPHIHKEIRNVGERVSKLEGRFDADAGLGRQVGRVRRTRNPERAVR